MRLTGDRMRAKFARAQRSAQLRRGRRLAWWIRLWGGEVGPRLRAEKGVHIRHLPHAGWQLGADVYLGRGVILDIGPDARFELADRVKLMHYTLVGAVESVAIDEFAQVGECSTIRDNDHDTTAGVSMSRAPVLSKPTRIGRDAWIARGVAVTAGADIGAGTVIGANAVVRGAIPAEVIAAGVPAKVIRPR